MRRLTTREQVLLGLVTVGGAGYLWYASQRAVISTTGPFEFASDGRRLADGAPRVPMALLDLSGEGYDRNGRDLFAYSQRPPTQAEIDAERLRQEAELERQRVMEEERRKREQEMQAQRQEQAALAPPPPPPEEVKQPPRIPYQYIGYLGPKDDRIAVFQEGEAQYLARTGELVQDTFKVVEIRYESVVMGFTDPEFAGRTRELPMISR
jgi:hypothetical protein